MPEQPLAFDTLAGWLACLEKLAPNEIDLSLERVREVLERLPLANPRRVLHVAGTNGKGSSAVMLEALLRANGERVGCYTSPHVSHYRERIRVDGQPVDDADIVAAFEAVEAVRQGVPLTYFEFGTLAALVVFERRGADSLVLEIGMGGRLDAVNVVEPDAGIVTNVTLDHCEWLGPDVESIAREKAGIMRPGRPLIFGGQAVPRAILSEAERLGADLRLAGRDFGFTVDPTNPSLWAWHGQRARLEGLRRPSLFGAVQLRNASAVLALIEALPLAQLLTPRIVNAAFADLRLAGRFQRIDTGRQWLLDVAHNADAARALGESLSEWPHPRPVTAIIGALADKDIEAIVRPLLPCVDRWIAVKPASPRALDARQLAQTIANLANKSCLVMETPAAALRDVDERLDPAGLILITGSFYTVGPALEWLTSRMRP